MGKKLSYKKLLSNLNGLTVRKLVPAGPGWVVEADQVMRSALIVEGLLILAIVGTGVSFETSRCKEHRLRSSSRRVVGVAEVGDVGDNFGVSIPGKLSLPKTPPELKMRRFRTFRRSCCYHDELSFRRFFVAGRLQFSNLPSN
jgi:hypothetical protein